MIGSEKDWNLANSINEQKSEIDFKISYKKHGLENSFLNFDGTLVCLDRKPISHKPEKKQKVKLASTAQRLFAVKIKETELPKAPSYLEVPRNRNNNASYIETLLGRVHQRFTCFVEKKDKIIKKDYDTTPYLGIPLHEYLTQNPKISYLDRLILVKKITQQVSVLYQHRILHCDLHQGNILISKDELGEFQVALIDFEYSKILPDDQDEIEIEDKEILKQDLIPPEIVYQDESGIAYFAEHPYLSEKTEVYALGLLFYQMQLDAFSTLALTAHYSLRPTLAQILESLEFAIQAEEFAKFDSALRELDLGAAVIFSDTQVQPYVTISQQPIEERALEASSQTPGYVTIQRP